MQPLSKLLVNIVMVAEMGVKRRKVRSKFDHVMVKLCDIDSTIHSETFCRLLRPNTDAIPDFSLCIPWPAGDDILRLPFGVDLHDPPGIGLREAGHIEKITVASERKCRVAVTNDLLTCREDHKAAALLCNP